jgi:hypothetical protein
VGGRAVAESPWSVRTGLPQQVVKVGSVWDASFCASFLPSVVSGSFGSGDPASPRIYPSYYLVDIARAG